jgi:hypothetical protein
MLVLSANFFSTLGCTSLFIFGWHYATLYDPVESTEQNPFGKKAKNKEIFWFFRFYIGNLLVKLFPKNGATIAKPIIRCVVCMASVYGTLFYFIFTDRNLFVWPIFVIALAGLNHIIKAIAQIE